MPWYPRTVRLLMTLALFVVLFASILVVAVAMVWAALALTHKTYLPNLWPAAALLVSVVAHLLALKLAKTRGNRD